MYLSHLKELHTHMQWADTTIWRAVLLSSEAGSDDLTMNTLLHLHETQHAFLSVWLKNPLQRSKRTDFHSPDEMCKWAKGFYAPASEFLESLSVADLTTPADLPWAKYFTERAGKPPASTTLGETIYQVVSHSMHHRGQISRRLSQLDGSAPLTDYIVWLWMDRPQAEWPS